MWPWLILAAVAVVFIVILQRQSRRERELRARLESNFREASVQQQVSDQTNFQARQQALFNGMIEGVLLLDQHGRVQMINESFRNFFNVTADIHGQPVTQVLNVPELAELTARLQKEKNISAVELEVRGSTRRSLEVNAAIVHDHLGTEQGQLFVFHDFTRMKELENFRKEFVANVSHELRTPLSFIKGYAQTLLDGAKDDPTQSVRFLQKIDKHSDRLHFLMEDLLAISHLESGQAILKYQLVNLHELAQRVLDDLVAPAAARSTVLDNEIPPGTSTWADADRLQQVLFNLAENAIKYGRSGGRVVVGASIDNEEKVEIYVEDDGPGIPPESIGRVFERFYRVDRARSRESGGTGLGLAIVKHIVQAHGGEARVKSELQKGTSFFFSLPRKPDANTPAN